MKITDARAWLTARSSRVRTQGGEVVIHDGFRILPEPFLDISSLVSCCGERGLLDITFHPHYADNGLIFIGYTDTSGNSVRFWMAPS